jgi:hypothetical protein
MLHQASPFSKADSVRSFSSSLSPIPSHVLRILLTMCYDFGALSIWGMGARLD